MEEIRSRLRKIGYHFNHFVYYATGFLRGIVKDKKEAFPRRSELVCFDRVLVIRRTGEYSVIDAPEKNPPVGRSAGKKRS